MHEIAVSNHEPYGVAEQTLFTMSITNDSPAFQIDRSTVQKRSAPSLNETLLLCDSQFDHALWSILHRPTNMASMSKCPQTEPSVSDANWPCWSFRQLDENIAREPSIGYFF